MMIKLLFVSFCALSCADWTAICDRSIVEETPSCGQSSSSPCKVTINAAYPLSSQCYRLSKTEDDSLSVYVQITETISFPTFSGPIVHLSPSLWQKLCPYLCTSGKCTSSPISCGLMEDSVDTCFTNDLGVHAEAISCSGQEVPTEVYLTKPPNGSVGNFIPPPVLEIPSIAQRAHAGLNQYQAVVEEGPCREFPDPVVPSYQPPNPGTESTSVTSIATTPAEVVDDKSTSAQPPTSAKTINIITRPANTEVATAPLTSAVETTDVLITVVDSSPAVKTVVETTKSEAEQQLLSSSGERSGFADSATSSDNIHTSAAISDSSSAPTVPRITDLTDLNVAEDVFTWLQRPQTYTTITLIELDNVNEPDKVTVPVVANENGEVMACKEAIVYHAEAMIHLECQNMCQYYYENLHLCPIKELLECVRLLHPYCA